MSSPAALDMDAVAAELGEALAYIDNLRRIHPYEALGSPHLTGERLPITAPTVTTSHTPVGNTNANTNTNRRFHTAETRVPHLTTTC